MHSQSVNFNGPARSCSRIGSQLREALQCRPLHGRLEYRPFDELNRCHRRRRWFPEWPSRFRPDALDRTSGKRWRAPRDLNPRHFRPEEGSSCKSRNSKLGGGEMINVLVIDDHWAIREGLTRIFQNHSEVHLTEAVGSLAEAHEFMLGASSTVDVVLLDVVLGDQSGIDSIPNLRDLYPSIRVLILTILPENPHAIRAIEQGADGFVSKGGSPNELVDAIRTIAQGHRYLSPNVGQLLAERLRKTSDLSARESEVVGYFANGMRCGEIANLLKLSPKTVSAHKSNAMRKLNVSSNVDLIRWALANKMTS
ncbi:MAG: response regulator transcription factor [Actinobacteria bacterium]|nr:response regulator transcription factor [Actinomycetota bacterium]